MKNALALILLLALCFAVAGLGGYWTSSSVGDWYQTLRRPSWTPPDWLFGPVWTLLYAMMAVAAWLIWLRRAETGSTTALTLFAIQLALNLAWSGLFFALKNPAAGFADIILLWLAILATMIAFWRLSTPAGLLLLPYLLWVSYATALNFALWRMN